MKVLIYPRYDMMKTILYLFGLPPQNPEPQYNHEQNIRQITYEGHSTKCLTNPPPS